MRTFLMCAGAALVLSACGNAEWHSINRSFSPGTGDSRLIDAKQRAIISVVDKQGNAIICAEPSPDALQATAAALAGGGGLSKAGADAFANIAGSTSEGAASIGLRTQSIQLLRDAYYRICEGNLNGSLDGTSYDILQRRFQNHMVALLAIEQLTGAVKAPPVTISATASSDAGANAAQLTAQANRAEEQLAVLEKRKATLAAERAGLNATTDKVRIAEIDAETGRLDGRIERQKKLIAALNDAFAGAVSETTEASSATSSVIAAEALAGPELPKHVSEAVENITLSALNQDYSAQLCFAELRAADETLTLKPIGSIIRGFCNDVFMSVVKNQTTLGDAQTKKLEFIGKIIDRVNSGKLTAADAAILIAAIDRSVSDIAGVIQPTKATAAPVGGS